MHTGKNVIGVSAEHASAGTRVPSASTRVTKQLSYSIMYLYGSGIAMLQALHNWDGLLLSSKDSFENGPSMSSLAGSE